MVKKRMFMGERNYYFDTHDKDKNKISNQTEQEWKQLIFKTVKDIKATNAWIVFHDKDSDEDGKIKGLHAHIIIKHKNTLSPNSVQKKLQIYDNPNNKQFDVIKDKVGMFRYLTHSSDKAMKDKKYRYDIDELIFLVNGERQNKEITRLQYTEEISGNEKVDSLNIKDVVKKAISDVAEGEMKSRDVKKMLKEKFDDEGIYEFIRHQNDFDRAAKQYQLDKEERMRMSGRTAINTFVYGDSGVGKSRWVSQFVNYICEREGNLYLDSVYSASANDNGNFNLLDKYVGEDILIVDDVDSTKIEPSIFLNAFDQNKVNLIPNRYKDKYSYFEKSFIIKSVNHIDDYLQPIYKRMDYKDKKSFENNKKQILRRINYAICITDKKIVIFENDSSKKFELRNSTKTEFEFNLSDENIGKNNEKIYDLLYKK